MRSEVNSTKKIVHSSEKLYPKTIFDFSEIILPRGLLSIGRLFLIKDYFHNDCKVYLDDPRNAFFITISYISRLVFRENCEEIYFIHSFSSQSTTGKHVSTRNYKGTLTGKAPRLEKYLDWKRFFRSTYFSCRGSFPVEQIAK